MSGEILRLMLGGAVDNMDGVLQSLAAPAQAPFLPSVSEVVSGLNGASQANLSGGKRGKSGGSKSQKSKKRRSKSRKSSRSKRADMRERYKLSPRKRRKSKTFHHVKK